jgi:hypothetical protein
MLTLVDPAIDALAAGLRELEPSSAARAAPIKPRSSGAKRAS